MKKEHKKLIEHFNDQKIDLLNEIKGGDDLHWWTWMQFTDSNGYIVNYQVEDAAQAGGHGLMGAGIKKII